MVKSARIPARTAPALKGFDPTWSRVVFIDDERINSDRIDDDFVNMPALARSGIELIPMLPSRSITRIP